MEEFDGVVGIVYRRKKNIEYLLIHNIKTGNITFPAGGRELNDISSLHTIQRELKEETGLKPGEYQIFKTDIVHTFVYNEKKKDRAGQTAKQLIYLVETDKDDFSPLDADSKIAGWYDKEAVLNKLSFDDSKELFKKAIKEIKVKL